MKNLYFSSLNYQEIERLKAAKSAKEFMDIFKEILQSLYYEDCFLRTSYQHPITDNVFDLFFGDNEQPFPTKGENLRLFPSAEAFQKMEKHFRIVERYKSLLKRPLSLCGRLKVNRKINKIDYEISAQELYSAMIYLFLHSELGSLEDFKSLLIEE